MGGFFVLFLVIPVGNCKRFQWLDIFVFFVFVDEFVCKIFFLIFGKIVRLTFRKIVGFFFVFLSFFKGFIQVRYFCWNYPIEYFFLSSSGFFVGCGLCQVHLCVDPRLLIFNISSHKRYEQCVFFFFGRIGKSGRPFSLVIVSFERFVFIKRFIFVVFLPCQGFLFFLHRGSQVRFRLVLFSLFFIVVHRTFRVRMDEFLSLILFFCGFFFFHS